MTNLDDELAEEYLVECREHLASVETDLLAIEKAGADIDEDLVNRVFRAVHSVKGGAGFFDLVKIGELAHHAEDVLSQIRSRKMVPTPERVRVLLRATDRLNDLVRNPGTSNQADIGEIVASLHALRNEPRPAVKEAAPPAERPRHESGPLRLLLAEDDFASRLVLQTFLSRYGECHVAVNGREAVEAFRAALNAGRRYDLVCMDVMMPELDGREAVHELRAMEEAHGIYSNTGARIIMTTTVVDIRQVIRCFQELCDSYLVKPIDLAQLLGLMKSYELVQ